MKSTNYLVTHTDVNTMGFAAKGSTPSNSNEIATKGWIDTYWYVDTTASPYSTYSSTRCPRYQDLVAPASVLSCFTYGNNGTQYTTGCNGYADEYTVYTATLRDQYGNPFVNNTGHTITITFSYDYDDVQDIGGSSGTAYADLEIYNGNSSGAYTFYTLTHQYCNYSSVCNGSCYSTQYNITYSSNSDSLSYC